jgi:flagellin
MRINQNVVAFNAYRNLSSTNVQQGKSLEKLSSGFRINRAADDAAGLVISENLRSQVRGLNQGVRNAQDGVSVVQTAEGALTEVHEMLQRIRELAVQSRNTATYGDSDEGTAVTAIQNEVSELAKEIGRIGTDTKFGELSLFDGDFDYKVQVGADDEQTIDITIDEVSTDDDEITIGDTTLDLSDIQADDLLADIDTAIGAVSTMRGTLGATQNRLEHTIANVSVTVENLQASESRIRDTDMAQEMVKHTRNQILSQAGTAMLAQANQVPQSVMSLLR